MTWLDLLWLVALGLLHWLNRARFARLPLHMDTGFYVTNAAIAERRYRPFRGWNTYFSGNSRLLPEWLHSTLYLRVGAERYPAAFRALYTWLTLVAALGYGALAWALLGTPRAFWPSAFCSAALLSEAQYGAYFESAETFEVAAQALGIACLAWGIALGMPGLGALGLGFLWLDALLLKSSAALACGLITLVLLGSDTLRWPALACAVLAAVGLYSLLRAATPSLTEKLLHMRRHERYVRRNYASPLRLMAVKLGFSGKLLARAPLLPALAGAGALALSLPLVAAEDGVLRVYTALGVGALAALLWQGNRVWYYMLPLVGLCGPLFTAALLALERSSGELLAALVGSSALCASYVLNLWQVRGSDQLLHSRRVFAVYDQGARGAAHGTRFAEANHELMLACRQFRARVQGQSLLVVGGHNQAYLQLKAAFDTPLVSVCELSAAVAGELSRFLPGVPELRAPRYLLDTCGALPNTCFGLIWLSSFLQIDSFGSIRLFERSEAAAD